MLLCFIEKALKAYVCDDKASQPEDYVSTCLHKGCALVEDSSKPGREECKIFMRWI